MPDYFSRNSNGYYFYPAVCFLVFRLSTGLVRGIMDKWYLVMKGVLSCTKGDVLGISMQTYCIGIRELNIGKREVEQHAQVRRASKPSCILAPEGER